MIDEYVDGRPMPSSSSALISDASVYRAGGLVVCPSAVSSVGVDALALVELRQPALGVVGLTAGLLVDALDVGLQEARERDGAAAGAEHDLLARRRLHR